MLTQNATWCQNRGCICISLVRRTYGRIHMLPSTIILWTELFPKERREKIQGEILQSSSSTSTVVFPQFYKNYTKSNIPTSLPVILCYSAYIINSSTRILQEILQLQGSSHAGSFQQLFPMSPSILHGRIRLPAPLQHSRAIQHKQASSNSTR